MSDVNTIVMTGKLTTDPKFTKNGKGTSILDFRIASNRRYPKDDKLIEETVYIDCTCFGSQAESMSSWLKKGRLISIEGRLRLDQWTGDDGNKRSNYSIVADKVNFMDRPIDKEGESSTRKIVSKEKKEVPF